MNHTQSGKQANFTIRCMTPSDVRLIRDWADAEGWNPGTFDGPAFFAADPEGYFLGELDGEPVACLSCVRYGEEYGFLGQYIVRPECRGRGFGFALWQAGMAHLAGRVVGLDGVLNQMANYERSGFRFAYHHIRYSGTGGENPPGGCVSLSEVPIDVVAEYDSRCFPGRRESFLRAWLELPDAVAVGCLRDRALTGYGLLRKSALGYKVGPLFADDAAIAARLLASLIAATPGEPFCIDIPDISVQPAISEIGRHFGLTEVFRTARMYRGSAPAHDQAKVFGVTSLELG